MCVLVLHLRLGQRRRVGEAPVHRLLAPVEQPLPSEASPARAAPAPRRRSPASGTAPPSCRSTPSRLNSARWMPMNSSAYSRHRSRNSSRDSVRLSTFCSLSRFSTACSMGSPWHVPAGDEVAPPPGQVAVLHHDVLEDLVERVAGVQVAVGVRRPVVEDEGLAAGVLLQQRPVGALGFPPREHRGSSWARFPFMGNSVRGRLRVCFQRLSPEASDMAVTNGKSVRLAPSVPARKPLFPRRC